MGSVSLKIGDGTARFKRATLCSSAVNILMICSIITTNLFALYAFTASPKDHHTQLLHNAQKNFSLISEQVSLILREIDLSQKKLAQIEKKLLGYESIDLSRPNIANELKLFLQRHQLPLGKDSKTGITEMVASVGHSCEKSADLLSQYMNYKVYGPCQDDWIVAQKLILRGCEPLPRRRCFAKSISKVGLNPFPTSLWKPVANKTVNWSGLSCKNFECLNGKKFLTRDCIGCFDLVNGYDNQRFIKSRSKNDFLIDDVLALGSGGIRIGLDVGGGSGGSFAAIMADRNVTVISNTLNIDAPFSEFIAARGLFPLFLSLDHRFPFYDNVFDLVHAASALDVGGKPEKLEFLMFDIDRILRAGGLFWLDNFYCADEEKKKALTRLIERFGYKKLKWVVGEKTNSLESGKSEVVLSAVLQKPVRV
ncbi:probable methyltransferase At1g29790 isoform X1 [Gastrolobium bilobum]|uniref:probable methyltransferase At1g29790 isoform X1 n=1 Tax=Gastrolobium bilobum TaxID=150636 RepID=UPI002AB1547F|nr:probable methyltransferase At1g29790 isoform X1 [Gastrolobium bilobum]